MRQIIGIGETVFDIIFKNDKPLTAVPGGSTFNAMISLGRTAGVKYPENPILMVTQTGSDHIGDIICNFMAENGVSQEAVTRRSGTQSHISMAFLDKNNDAQYEFYKDHEHDSLDADTLTTLKFHKDDIVLFGSYFAINPVIRDFTSSLLHAAHEAGAIIYYDINFRRNHLKDLDKTIGNIQENIRLSDFVRGSSEDFEILFGGSSEEIYSKHIAPLCRNLIYTCGPEPAQVFAGDFRQSYPMPKIKAISTIGAGDNFNAGFIYSIIASGISKEQCSQLNPEQWRKMIETASKFSADVCQRSENYVGPQFKV